MNQFQILQKLCQLSITAVENGLQTLYSSQLISGQLLSKDLFEAELRSGYSCISKDYNCKLLARIYIGAFANVWKSVDACR
jgi:hypothetical protein